MVPFVTLLVLFIFFFVFDLEFLCSSCGSFVGHNFYQTEFILKGKAAETFKIFS